MGRPRVDPAERFWAKVKVGAPDECWPFEGGTSTSERTDRHGNPVKGYGSFWCDRPTLAHRFAFEAVNGPVPEGLEVLHTCDHPDCVNPAHLVAGTHLANMADARNKERLQHRLSLDDHLTVCTMAATGERLVDIADHFGVHRMSVRDRLDTSLDGRQMVAGLTIGAGVETGSDHMDH